MYWQLHCSSKGRSSGIESIRIRAIETGFFFTPSSQIFHICPWIGRSWNFVYEGKISGLSYASFQEPLNALSCKCYAFVRILLSLVLIHNLGMRFDYVLFRSSGNSNLCPLESQTCCQDKRNLERKLGLFFENIFSSWKVQGLLQRKLWQWVK